MANRSMPCTSRGSRSSSASRLMMIRSDSILHTCMATSLWRHGCSSTHLSLMMEYDALSQIYLNGKEKNVSFEDLRQALQKVKAVKLDGKWIPSVRRKKIAEIADAVSFNPWIISLPIQQPKN